MMRSARDVIRITMVPASMLILVLVSCAGSSTWSPPPLLVEATRDGQGWPFGESGRGPVRSLTETSTDPRYGWSSRKPVELGGFDAEPQADDRMTSQVRYLNSLWGPQGETIFYERIGTCCPFQMYGAPLDKGMLDIYSLTWDGQEEPRHLYLDGFRTGVVRIPAGLTSKVR